MPNWMSIEECEECAAYLEGLELFDAYCCSYLCRNCYDAHMLDHEANDD